MKDATGELSMTAVAVVAIAAISVVFTTLIYPTIKANILRSTHCSQVNRCDDVTGDTGTVTCYYCKDADCTEEGEVQCTPQGTND